MKLSFWQGFFRKQRLILQELLLNNANSRNRKGSLGSGGENLCIQMKSSLLPYGMWEFH